MVKRLGEPLCKRHFRLVTLILMCTVVICVVVLLDFFSSSDLPDEKRDESHSAASFLTNFS